LSAVVPTARGVLDRVIVTAERERVVALIHQTRQIALERGGAALELDAEQGWASILVGDSAVVRARVPAERRARLRLGGGRERTVVPYNGLGLGVFAVETIELVAGGALGRVVVSGYGRVRREP